MLNKLLFKQIDNSPLIVFRMIFGLLCFLESVGAIFTGWVSRAFVNPKFTFTFIGFDFLQPLPGYGMYIYYAVMGVFGLGIMLGYKYKFSTIGFTLLWGTTYFMQKSSYNNHYYLLLLLSGIMALQPANRYASIDVKQNPSLKTTSMLSWYKWLFIIQLFIVYTYASIAKLYPDWLDLTVPKFLLAAKQNYPIIGDWLQHYTMPYIVAYGGIFYDGLIIPFLFFKRTRKIAFIASIGFHIFNSIVFQVGIFPYLALAFSLFFFDSKLINKRFLKSKPYYNDNEVTPKNYKPWFIALGSIYLAIQVILPIRHHFIKGNVLWTEEGHRLSWRMMLRSRSGYGDYTIFNHTTKQKERVNINDYLTRKQQKHIFTKPDFAWQFAQHLKKKYLKQGDSISVFANCNVSINRKPYKKLISPSIDLANEEWNYIKHNDWILPEETNK